MSKTGSISDFCVVLLAACGPYTGECRDSFGLFARTYDIPMSGAALDANGTLVTFPLPEGRLGRVEISPDATHVFVVLNDDHDGYDRAAGFGCGEIETATGNFKKRVCNDPIYGPDGRLHYLDTSENLVTLNVVNDGVPSAVSSAPITKGSCEGFGFPTPDHTAVACADGIVELGADMEPRVTPWPIAARYVWDATVVGDTLFAIITLTSDDRVLERARRADDGTWTFERVAKLNTESDLIAFDADHVAATHGTSPGGAYARGGDGKWSTKNFAHVRGFLAVRGDTVLVIERDATGDEPRVTGGGPDVRYLAWEEDERWNAVRYRCDGLACTQIDSTPTGHSTLEGTAQCYSF